MENKEFLLKVYLEVFNFQKQYYPDLYKTF